MSIIRTHAPLSPASNPQLGFLTRRGGCEERDLPSMGWTIDVVHWVPPLSRVQGNRPARFDLSAHRPMLCRSMATIFVGMRPTTGVYLSGGDCPRTSRAAHSRHRLARRLN
jgi:hypothetical protein